MSCFSRVGTLVHLVIGNTLVVGGTAALVFGLVKLARTPHSALSIVIVSMTLVSWLGLNAFIYPAFCSSLFSWSALGRCLERPVSAVLWILCLPSMCTRALRRQRRRRSDAAAGGLPQFVTQSRGHTISVLPRELPVHGGVLPVGGAIAGIPAYEQPDGGASPDCTNNNAQLANQAQVNWPAWNNNAPNVAPAVHPEEEVVAQNVIPDLNNAAEVADGEDFIPLPVLNQQEEEELDEIDNLANPEIQMAIALNIPAAVAQQAQEHSSYTDSVSFPSSNTSSVNMDIPEDQLDLALGLPAIQPVQPQQQPSPESFLADEIQEDDLLPEN
ncbi:unnamed protein product [Urochloa humidicola]